MDRRKPHLASGILAALLLAPRDFAYTLCDSCQRKLFYIYPGELCPHCNARVKHFVEGQFPDVIASDGITMLKTTGHGRRRLAQDVGAWL